MPRNVHNMHGALLAEQFDRLRAEETENNKSDLTMKSSIKLVAPAKPMPPDTAVLTGSASDPKFKKIPFVLQSNQQNSAQPSNLAEGGKRCKRCSRS